MSNAVICDVCGRTFPMGKASALLRMGHAADRIKDDSIPWKDVHLVDICYECSNALYIAIEKVRHDRNNT